VDILPLNHNLPINTNNLHTCTNGDEDDSNKDNNDRDDGAIASPKVLAHVNLAKTITHKHSLILFLYIIDSNLSGRQVDAHDLAVKINQHDFVLLICQFLYEQLHCDSKSTSSSSRTSNSRLPVFWEPLSIYSSALATFHAPSDICGAGGMQCEHIRAVPAWEKDWL